MGTLKTGEIILHRQVTLLETDDAPLMAELCADARVGAVIAATLTPCLAVVGAGTTAYLIENLLKAGHTPKVLEK